MKQLINGDALKAMDKMIKDGIKVDLIYIDPPYDFESGKKQGSKMGERLERVLNKETLNIRNGFDYQAYAKRFKKIQNKTNIYIWCSKNQIRDILNMFPNLNPYILFWGKTNPPPAFNGTYLSNTEYILYFKEKGTSKLNTTYKTASRFDIQPINTKDKRKYKHPTIKPLNIVEKHIFNSTNENDVVFDCFMGSGTTGIACKNLKRNFIGVELDKDYYEIAKERINKH